jgi:hypothetical protein
MSIIEHENLNDKHPTHELMLEKWSFWASAYEGEDAFIASVITKHERESEENHKDRKKNAEVFNYCSTIVDIFSNYLTEVKAHKELGILTDDKQYETFTHDVDLYGTDYNVFWSGVTKKAGVYGFCGILVDKPQGDTDTRLDELSKNIYPYYSVFTPENICDWLWVRNPKTARPELSFLKLREGDESYLIWTKDEWERWTLVPGQDTVYEITETGVNPLGKIPFVWYVNIPNISKKIIGKSDISSISRIQASITRNLSQGSEVVNYAAFPMLIKPEDRRPSEEGDQVGPTAVLDFDPEYPESKPSWLASEAKAPIDAILEWISLKIDEIYRTAHLSGVHGQTKSDQAKSGVALKYELQQLFSVLSAKAGQLDEAELQSLLLWVEWQGQKTENMTVSRPKVFVLEDVNELIETLLVSKSIVKSETFDKIAQKKLAKMTLQTETDAILQQIDKEIDSNAYSQTDNQGE